MHSDARPRRPPTGGRSSQLYDQLLAFDPSPVVALNRAVAVAEVDGRTGAAPRGRRSTSACTTSSTRSAPTCCAPRPEAEAAQAYEAAIALTENAAEKSFYGVALEALIRLTDRCVLATPEPREARGAPAKIGTVPAAHDVWDVAEVHRAFREKECSASLRKTEHSNRSHQNLVRPRLWAAEALSTIGVTPLKEARNFLYQGHPGILARSTPLPLR